LTRFWSVTFEKLDEYFLKDSDSKKVYAILCLYFFTYSIDANGDRNPRFASFYSDLYT
jgi:hypothetical protein